MGTPPRDGMRVEWNMECGLQDNLVELLARLHRGVLTVSGVSSSPLFLVGLEKDGKLICHSLDSKHVMLFDWRLLRPVE